MASKSKKKKYYTVEEANAMLPLLRVIVRDITQLAGELRESHETLLRIEAEGEQSAQRDHLGGIYDDYQIGQQRLRDYEQELADLQVELKDYFTGLIDFPCKMDGREVFLSWKLGEDEVEHWHEVDAGFAGRQKLAKGAEL